MSPEQRAEVLLNPWRGPHGGVPPFDLADPDSIEIAYRRAIAMMRDEVDTIATQPSPPTFENTVAALEDAGRVLTRADALFRVFCSTQLNEAMVGVQSRLAPLRPALDDAIAHNDMLYARLTAVRATPGLDGQDRRLVDVICLRMAKLGAGLDPVKRARLAAINQELADIQARFGQNIQEDSDGQYVAIDNPEDLAGLSEATIASLAGEAQRRGTTARHVVANQRGMFDAIMAEAHTRDLRERVWQMWTRRGCNSNGTLANAILQLRGEKAALLGFGNYADYATSHRMAGSAARALSLCDRVTKNALTASEAYMTQIAALAVDNGWREPIEAWDRPYWSARLAARDAGFDLADLTPYLSLDAMMAAMFWASGQLYGLSFEPVGNVPVLHPDIRVYEVKQWGTAIGLLYADLFTRPGKRGTAWMDEYRTSETFRGGVTAIASINHCLAPTGAGQPVLLSWDNARVLFHEMGHALHALLTRVDYPSLGIMNVAWDAIELPSQIFETLIATPEILRRFARHYQTDAPMPAHWVDRMTGAAMPDAGGWVLAQTASAIVDLKLHMAADGNPVDAAMIEADALAAMGLPRSIDPRHRVPHFMHIFFAESYAAGYYSYHWADVMVADAAELFNASEGRLFDRPTAQRFLSRLLGVGSSVPADQAYRDFAGRDPDPDALIRKLGLAA